MNAMNATTTVTCNNCENTMDREAGVREYTCTRCGQPVRIPVGEPVGSIPEAITNELRALGYTGDADDDGVMKPGVTMTLEDRAELTRRVLELLRALHGYAQAGRPLFYLQTTPRVGRDRTPRVDWFATAELLVHALESRGAADPGDGLIGTQSSQYNRWVWGPVPPAEELAALPGSETVICWPHWWIQGPGNRIASRMPCAHGYHLTDSCPNCDADQEADATSTAPTGREKPGEHWNARLIRWQRLREISEGTVPSLEQHAAEWNPDVVDVLKAGDPDNAAVYEAARANLQDREAKRHQVLAGLENQMRLALKSSEVNQRENEHRLMADVRTKGAVRAMQLHGKEAARLDLTVRVWERAVESGRESGDWLQALQSTRTFACEQLRHNATARTRNRVDGALAAVMVDAASDLIDAMDGMLAKARQS